MVSTKAIRNYQSACDIARKKGVPSAVMILSRILFCFKNDVVNFRLTNLEQKTKLIESFGVDFFLL